VAVNFLPMDALAVGEIPERFDAVTDCGLFHTFDDAGRAAYVAALASLLEPGARLFILCTAVFEVVPGIPGAEFSPGGARAWFATVRRTA
jgi:hypothetical protein